MPDLPQILSDVLDRPDSDRSAFLDGACGNNASLRAEVEALIEAHEKADSFLAEPLVTGPAVDATVGTALSEGPGTVIDKYKLLQLIGEGGFGAVYMAEQQKPVKRRVALKIIKLGMDTKQVIARFEAERQALAMMNHPNIATVLDAGATETGRPYFVMELVKGIPITEYCDQNNLTVQARLDLFKLVCAAVQHAHQKGIIHRDIKPSNVMVTLHDGKPVPKVIDFGIAKAMNRELTDKTLFTEYRQLVGTPQYMSPEQAEMSGLDIDTRSDIYALGVLLYELLTGTTPFDPKRLREAGLNEIQRIIREEEPHKPSTRLSTLDTLASIAAHRGIEPRKLGLQIRGDLDWIIMKAMEKDRTRRYDTAAGFAADIDRHLSNEPVLASPPSAGYRLRKFVRRNRTGVMTALVVIAVSVIGAVVSINYAIGEAHQRRIAQAAEQEQNHARKEAEAAREETQKRADELQTVTEFQASMLGEIDAEKMGNGIFDDLRERIRESLTVKNTASEDIDEALASFDTLVTDVNTTNLALKIIDENVLSRAVKTIEKKFADQPLVRAALQQTVANTYGDIGLYEPAMPLQQAALETRRQELGDDHPLALASINNMGLLLRAMGKLAEAEPYYREALEGRRRELGDDHPGTLQSINNMGFLLHSMSKYEEALAYYREALEGRRRVLGDDHPDTLQSINNIGGLLIAMGKYEEALAYYREALEGRRRVLGDDHPDTLHSINNMGGLLESMGKYEETLGYFREALDGHRRVLGDDHPDTLTSINNMGLLLKAMGKLQEAEPYFREALDGHRRVLGDDHPSTLRSINNMGFLLRAMAEYEEALPYYREALEGSRRVLGDDHSGTLTSINNMGSLLLSMGKYEEVLPYYREALESRRRVLGDDHPDTLTSINNMGMLLQSRGKYEEALPFYREALEGYRSVLGDDHPGTLISINNMGRLLRELGRLEEAEALGAEAVRGTSAKLALLHPFRLAALAEHGRTLAGMQKFAEAETELLKAHEGFFQTLGRDHQRTIGTIRFLVDLYDGWHEAQPDQGYDAQAAEWRAKLPPAERAGSLVKLGMNFIEQRNFAEAEPLLRESLEIRQEALPEGHWLIFNTMSVLGESLAMPDKFAEAEPLLLDGYEGLTTAGETIPAQVRDQRLREAIQRVVDLYEAWHEAEPNKGHDAKAAQWRAKLPQSPDRSGQEEESDE